MPKLAPPPPVVETESAYPAGLGDALGPYAHQVLGDLGGLTTIGVHLEILPPGSASSLRHWHEAEDEFVWVLSGEVMLHENDGETPLRAGEAAAWPAGAANGHRLVNRGAVEARYLVVGTRAAADVVRYPDDDLLYVRDAAGRRRTRADGSPLP